MAKSHSSINKLLGSYENYYVIEWGDNSEKYTSWTIIYSDITITFWRWIMSFKPIKKILLVEDDQGIADYVIEFMQQKLIAVDHANKASVAKQFLSENYYDVLVLDLNLPDAYGIDFCKELRQQMDRTPVLILSANSGDVNRIIGLEAGANDYLEKPFNMHELHVRLKNLFNMTENTAVSTKAKYGSANFNGFSYIFKDKTLLNIWEDQQKFQLSKTEAGVLEIFLTRPEQLVTKHQIAEQLGLVDQANSRSVDQVIARIRSKINDGNAQMLRTIRGHGYMFVGRVSYK